MFDHRQSKLLRKQFEERKWKLGETFSTYYHEKIILANKVPVNEEETLEYIIEGISNMQLRNQAKVQKFESTAELLAAFESVDAAEEKTRTERESRWKNKEQKESRHQGKALIRKDATEESSVSQTKVRCYNYSKFGHLSKDCKAPKREKGTCFKCGEKGHVISECSSSTVSTQINYVNIVSTKNEFQRTVTIKASDTNGNFEVKVDALMDTGSPISFVKEKFIPSYCIKKSDNSNRFYGINNSKLDVIGTATIDIQYDKVNETGISVYFVVDGTMTSSMVIGRDLLQKAEVSLVAMPEEVGGNIADEILNINVCDYSDSVEEMLVINPEICYAKQLELKNIFEKEYVLPERSPEPKVNAELTLKFNNIQNFYFSPRRLSYSEKEQLRKILDDWLAKGVIRNSTSEYASPVVLVRKKNGEYRLCIDYRTLNKYLLRDNYPIPVIEDQLNVLKGKQYFSILDLKDGFFHINMAEESVKYTAFITPFGQFEFLKMPFGLKTAPIRFQKFVNEVIDELIRTGDALVYIDDFLIATESLEHHLRILKRVCKLMVENRLNLRLDKCKFLFTKIEYLGYLVTPQGISPTNSGIEAVSKFPVPHSVRSV